MNNYLFMGLWMLLLKMYTVFCHSIMLFSKQKESFQIGSQLLKKTNYYI